MIRRMATTILALVAAAGIGGAVAPAADAATGSPTSSRQQYCHDGKAIYARLAREARAQNKAADHFRAQARQLSGNARRAAETSAELYRLRAYETGERRASVYRQLKGAHCV